MNFDKDKLSVLLENHDYAGAKALLDDYFKNGVSDAEQGAAYAQLVEVYMAVTIRLNKSEEAVLAATDHLAQESLKMENKQADEIGLKQARSSLE